MWLNASVCKQGIIESGFCNDTIVSTHRNSVARIFMALSLYFTAVG